VATRAPQEADVLTPAQALAFVERYGIVCEAARRAGIPSLVDAIAGEAVHGNWWSHRHSREIFALTRAVRAAPQLLVCRLVDGKITFVHDRLWPALVRAAGRFPRECLARLHEVHTTRGNHVVEETAFPDWLPAALASTAKHLTEKDAIDALRVVLPKAASAVPPLRRRQPGAELD
jgi:hypothetical protein